jgi:GNAT superfamily N-acetyltransferase
LTGDREVRIRRALPEEGPSLRQIAIASKGHWGYDPEFLARFAGILTLDPEHIRANDVWVIEVDGVAAGFYKLIHHGEVSELDDLWLLPRHIGKGLGRPLFEHAAGRASEHGAKRLEWEAEPNAVGFYERMGGTAVRETTSQLGRTLQIFALGLPLDAERKPSTQM